MRKLLFIVLAFTACLLFPEGGDGACIRQQAPSAAFSAGDMHADEWQCERTYNSDLNHQPRGCAGQDSASRSSLRSVTATGKFRPNAPSCAAPLRGAAVRELPS